MRLSSINTLQQVSETGAADSRPVASKQSNTISTRAAKQHAVAPPAITVNKLLKFGTCGLAAMSGLLSPVAAVCTTTSTGITIRRFWWNPPAWPNACDNGNEITYDEAADLCIRAAQSVMGEATGLVCMNGVAVGLNLVDVNYTCWIKICR